MKKRAFTLVEIMIVVAIIGLLAAVGIPSILTSMTKSQEKMKARNIQDVLRAKGFCMMPTDMGGIDAKDGDEVSDDVCALLDGVSNTDDLTVGPYKITIGKIGELPLYSKD